MKIGPGQRALAWMTLSVAVLTLLWNTFLAVTQSLTPGQLLTASAQVVSLLALGSAPLIRPSRPRLADRLFLVAVLLFLVVFVLSIAQEFRQ